MIDDLDLKPYEEYFKVDYISNKKHRRPTSTYYLLVDSLTREGRRYCIALTHPETERTLFNEDNPDTKVETLLEYPK